MGIHVMRGLDPGYLNAGLMKPRRGSTPIPGKEELGVGKFLNPIDLAAVSQYSEV